MPPTKPGVFDDSTKLERLTDKALDNAERNTRLADQTQTKSSGTSYARKPSCYNRAQHASKSG